MRLGFYLTLLFFSSISLNTYATGFFKITGFKNKYAAVSPLGTNYSNDYIIKNGGLSRLEPGYRLIKIAGLESGVTSVISNFYHTCVIQNGGAKCWGENNKGQLGDGSTTDSAVPVGVVGLSSGVTKIVLGHEYTCAIHNSAVKCWGSNSVGQLGIGSSGAHSTVPVDVLGLTSGVRSIFTDVYGTNTCAIKDGRILCWGPLLWYSSNTPEAIPEIIDTGITSMSSDGSSLCYISNGNLKCMGQNDRGQLGNSGYAYESQPVWILNAQEVSFGIDRTTALADGGLYYWGDDYFISHYHDINLDEEIDYGDTNEYWGESGWNNIPYFVEYNVQSLVPVLQAGYLTRNVRSYYTFIEEVYDYEPHNPSKWSTQHYSFLYKDLKILGVHNIAVGNGHTCLLINGSVKCWGLNSSGQLGDGTTDDSLKAVDNYMLMDSGVTKVAAGLNYSCAIANAAVKCWGENVHGQLGDGTNLSSSSIPILPVGLNSGVTQVSVNTRHSCAIQNGAVKCWGDNTYGQLGDGTTTNSLIPISSSLSTDATEVAVGDKHSCAIQNGGVLCWGNNDYGQLGDGTEVASAIPVAVSGLNSGVTEIAAGLNHTCAIHNGAVKCWGLGASGQLGHGILGNETSPVTVSGSIQGAKGLTAGGNTTCVISNGGIKCWGDNSFGQLGDGTFNNSSVPVSVISLPEGGAFVVSTSGTHTCALTDKIKCWGKNSSGQLGNFKTANSATPLRARFRK